MAREASNHTAALPTILWKSAAPNRDSTLFDASTGTTWRLAVPLALLLSAQSACASAILLAKPSHGGVAADNEQPMSTLAGTVPVFPGSPAEDTGHASNPSQDTGKEMTDDASAASARGDEWRYTTAFYTWLAGIDGTMAVFGAPAVDASASVSDVLKKLDAGVMGLGEARRGRFSLAGDVFWARLSERHDLPAPIAGNVKLTTESGMVTAAAGYAFVQEATRGADVIAGARYWSVKNTLGFDGGALDGASARDKADWVDPLVGIKGSAKLSSKFFFNGWAIAGGFGAGSDSMWDVMVSLGYAINDKWSVAAGYRVLRVDYEKDDFAYDVKQSGPLLSLIAGF